MAGPSSHLPGHLPGHGRHYGRPLSVWSPAIVAASPAWPALWPASPKTSISCLGPLPFSSKPSTRVSPPLEGTQASPPPLLSIFSHPPSIPCPNPKPLGPIFLSIQVISSIGVGIWRSPKFLVVVRGLYLSPSSKNHLGQGWLPTRV